MKYNLTRHLFNNNIKNYMPIKNFANSLKFLFILLVSLTFFSCKKKDAAEPINNSSSTPLTGNYGSFTSRKQVLYSNSMISSFGNFTNAYVSSSALIGNNPMANSLLNIGAVSLNGTVLQKNAYTASNMYGDSTSSVFNTPLNWEITGSSAVSSFSFSNTNPYPSYTGYTAIADSFVIANNISIPLNNYSGSDEIETYFVTSTNPVTITSIQNITTNPSTLNFTSTDLGVVGVNSNVTLVINFYKNNIQNINGKNYNFRTGYSFMKSNIKFK